MAKRGDKAKLPGQTICYSCGSWLVSDWRRGEMRCDNANCTMYLPALAAPTDVPRPTTPEEAHP